MLNRARIRTAGAGLGSEAWEPAVIETGNGRVLVFAFGLPTSGIPPEWEARDDRWGVSLLHDLSERSIWKIRDQVAEFKRRGDIAIASIHWGENWGYEISREESTFAHRLLDEAGIDLIHGHSSHHAKGIEVYHDKAIIYGCGDFLNDYEGIEGYTEFRNDLAVMYFPILDSASGMLVEFSMAVMKIERFQLRNAPHADVVWMEKVLSREGRRLGTRVSVESDGSLKLDWRRAS